LLERVLRVSACFLWCLETLCSSCSSRVRREESSQYYEVGT
jgi:hypothetical protein